MDEDQTLVNDAELSDEALGQGAPEQDVPLRDDSANSAAETDPHGIKKRLGVMAKKHDRELREHRRIIDALQAQLATAPSHQNSFPSPGQPEPLPVTEEDRIKQAVHYALTAKDRAEQEAAMRARQAHVERQYERLRNDFDNAYDKYPDFDEKVRAHDVPFTEAIRDALLLIDNPVDVAYSLADKREELQRIAALHPLDQAREVNRLSRALERGQAQPANTAPANRANPIGQIRANPAGTAALKDTSAASIRARMKSGTWK